MYVLDFSNSFLNFLNFLEKLKCDWYSHELLPSFRDNCFELHYMDDDSVVFLFTWIKVLIDELKQFRNDLDLMDLDLKYLNLSHELHPKDKKVQRQNETWIKPGYKVVWSCITFEKSYFVKKKQQVTRKQNKKESK